VFTSSDPDGSFFPLGITEPVNRPESQLGSEFTVDQSGSWRRVHTAGVQKTSIRIGEVGLG
jgi:hypothetical protein